MSSIIKAFEMCKVRQWNLSYECLVSCEAWQALRDLKETEPTFYNELVQGKATLLPSEKDVLPEDEIVSSEIEDIGCDDCDIPISKVVAAIVDQNIPEGTDLCPNGGLMLIAAAESIEEEGHEGEGKAAVDMRAVAEGENKG